MREGEICIRDRRFPTYLARISLQKTLVSGIQKLVVIDSGNFRSNTYIGSTMIHKYVRSIEGKVT